MTIGYEHFLPGEEAANYAAAEAEQARWPEGRALYLRVATLETIVTLLAKALIDSNIPVSPAVRDLLPKEVEK